MAEETDNAEDAEEGAGGGKKRLIIIIVAAVLLLLGITAGVLWWLGGDEPAEGETSEEVIEEALPEGDPIYTQLKPQFTVNLPAGGRASMLQLGVTVYTRHAPVAEFIAANDPMIRHHVIDFLEQQDSKALFTVEGKKALQKGLQELISAQLTENQVEGELKGVFFTEFVLQ